MLKNITAIFIIAFLIIDVKLYSQTVQAGISSSGTDLIVSVKPNYDIDSLTKSSVNIVIAWPTSYGVTLGSITNTFGTYSKNSQGTSGGTTDYVEFSDLTATDTIFNWSAGNNYELFRVAVNQRDAMPYSGTFTLSSSIAGGWYFEVASFDRTNYSTPFYASSVSGVPLPVELKSFNAKVKGSNVELLWQTATEVNNYGFDVERKAIDAEAATWEKVGFIEGSGNSNSPKDYTYTDKNITGGSNFSYRLKQIDNDGTFSYSSDVNVEVIPDKFELFQNYPNPFNPSTTIKFSLPQDSRIVINIYNILGEKVTQLLNADYKAGYYKVLLNSTDLNLASGIYFYTIESKNFKAVKKMILMK
jgi:hypothetical protein